MIIKFDHITYVANRKDRSKLEYRDEDFFFVEKNLKNLDNKKSLMKYNQETHDLYFYNQETMPIEYIFYDETYTRNTNIKIDKYDIYASYSNKELAYDFLQKVFKKVEIDNDEIICCISGLLDKTKYYLHLSLSEKNDMYLDQEGYGTPTLMCNSLPKDVDEYLTAKNEIVVNGNKFDICFLKCNYINVIFEILLTKKEA